MLCGFGRRSSLRPSSALLVALSTVLVLLAGACRPSADTAGEVELAGQRFTIVLDDEWPYSVVSIEEMERIGGFPFIFPSYLPEGMDGKMELSAWPGGEETVGGVQYETYPKESVLIYRKRVDAPGITITQRKPPFLEAYPDSTSAPESHTIAGTEVFCHVHNPWDHVVLLCYWLIEDRGFEALFSWTVGSPTPYFIAEDMREEALKVIQSMIEAPIQLGSAEAE